jgi:sugar/nucleoside kinase (ribokinase family)
MDHPAPPAVVVGCLTVDNVVTAEGALIPSVCGGNSLYALVGARLWGPSVGLVARVGDDYPVACLDAISAAVDIGGLRHRDGPHPLRVAFAYRPDGSRTRTIPSDVQARIPAELRPAFLDNTIDDARYLRGTPTPDEIPDAWLDGASAFHLPALLVASLVPLIATIRSRRPQCIITVDAPFYAHRDGTVTEDLAMLDGVDAVLPSEDDLRQFRPSGSLLDGARVLLDAGAQFAVVKLGADGSVVLDRAGSITHVPAYPAQAVDPTGAGDSYCGGFLIGLRETGDPVRAAMYGTVAASFVVEERTAIPVFARPREDAEARLIILEALVTGGPPDDVRRRLTATGRPA